MECDAAILKYQKKRKLTLVVISITCILLTPVFLLGESQGRQSLVGCGLWDCTESDTTEAT